MYKERENVGEEGEMPGIWDDLDSVRNSEDFGQEHVSNMQEEPSIIDSPNE